MEKKKKIVVLSGAGISAESGLATFRDSGGLWEGYKIEDVATPEAWKRNQMLVLDFYNQRRKAARNAEPNAGHIALVKLEEKYDVTIITQNVDDLHERAGSSHVLHLHGELFKSRSSLDESLIYPIEGWELKKGDKCVKGSQLRPHIVWFGEAVPMMDRAIKETMQAEIFIVVGTSLQVYPAAGLIDFVPLTSVSYIVDPNVANLTISHNVISIQEKAATGLPSLVNTLIQ